MDLEENEEKELLDDEPEDEKESRDEIEESIEQEIQDALNGKESDKSSDDEMEKLRLEALNSQKQKRSRPDSCGTNDSEDDELTAMRRELLAQRAQKKPNDLRARLGKRNKVSAFINPHVTPKKPVTVSKMQFPNFEVNRTVDNSNGKKREIVSETKSKFKITRTVKNEISSAAQFAYSDSDEIEVNLKPTKKSKKTKARAVFENAAEMKVQSEESLDELSSESESSESDDNRAQMFVLKAGDKRGVVKKVKSPSRSKKSKKESPKAARESRIVKDKGKSKKRSEKEDELEKKMERIRRDNEKREKRAKLIEKEKRKYSSKRR